MGEVPAPAHAHKLRACATFETIDGKLRLVAVLRVAARERGEALSSNTWRMRCWMNARELTESPYPWVWHDGFPADVLMRNKGFVRD